jgi:BMFP domain-containing protein YqiC
MIDKEFLQTLSQRLVEKLPELGTLREDMEKQFYSLLRGSFAKLNLVSREEFDAQLKVLQRTEQQLAELEAKLEKLEVRH